MDAQSDQTSGVAIVTTKCPAALRRTSFKGATPYHQAFDKGMKIIGAKAHHVTTNLDEGPIIEQEVQRVDHRHAPEQLMQRGQEVESAVLARAVAWHAKRRILLTGGETVVFRR